MKSFNTIFFTKNDKVSDSQQVAIYCKIRIDSDVATLSTGVYADPERWKMTKQFSVTRNESEKAIKVVLVAISKKLEDIYMLNASTGRILTASQLKEQYLNPTKFNVNGKKTLQELFALHLEKFKNKVKSEQRSIQSLNKYTTVQKHINEYLSFKYNASDILLTYLNFEFIESFDSFLRNNKGCINNTTVKYCQFLRSVISTGIKFEWLTKDPFARYEGVIEEVNTRFLTMEQISAISNKEIKNERLSIIRDTFLLSVYTGYAPCDVANLTWDDIQVKADGTSWIFTARKKTKIQAHVPLLPPALKIINKYKDHPKCAIKKNLVPLNSNQTLNTYLKELGDICNIDFDLHFYVARHTFATTITLSQGVSMESVSKMLGHRRLSQTQTYAKILNEKVGNEMATLALKYNEI